MSGCYQIGNAPGSNSRPSKTGVSSGTSADSGVTNNQSVSFGGSKRRMDVVPGFIDCDFSTLMCTDGKQLTGCRVQNGHTAQMTVAYIQSAGYGKCNLNKGSTQGNGGDTGAAAPSAAFKSSTSSITTQSSGAADLRPHAVGALLAIGAFASMLL